MKFELHTLVDITDPIQADNTFYKNQHQNYLTTIQTLGLRANVEIFTKTSKIVDINTLAFGRQYDGEQKVWSMIFGYDYEFTTDMLITDFNCVPFIDQLSETVEFDFVSFLTNSTKSKNIIFNLLDKY